MKFFRLLLFAILYSPICSAQNFTIRGFLYDENGEPMPFEKVRLLNEDSTSFGGTITKESGLFQISKIPKGNYILKIQSISYEVVWERIEVTQSKGILDRSFELKKLSSVLTMEEVKVSAEQKRKKNEVLISEIKLDKKGIERIPSIGAENDIVGAFSVTPGVTTTGDQGGQLYVRGGTPIQNKILLDGMTVYSPFHSIGFFSVFETELIQSTKILTGGFDAKYGGRISSIMDISYRDGNRKKIAGKVSASPFLAKAVLEGPLSKPKDGNPGAGSFVFSAKHSLLDYTSQSLYSRINDSLGMPFRFTDLYGKLTFKGKSGSKVSVFGFHNRDSVNYAIADLDWQSTGGGVNFIMVPSSSPVFIEGHLTGSNYRTSFIETGEAPRSSSISGVDLGFDFTYFTSNESEFNYGLNISGFSVAYETFNELSRRISDENWSTEIGAYLSYRYVSTRWVLQPSIRFQAYASLSTIVPEPRLGIKFNASETFRLKASGGRFSQNFTSASSDKDIVNLFNGLLSSPTNVQETFVTQFQNERNPKNGIQYAWHAIAGFEYDVSKKLLYNLEGYYKYFPQLSNINQNKLYEDISEFSDIDDIYKKDFILETGDAYGVDLLVKYSTDRLFVWGVYSLSKSSRWDGFEFYAPVFDRRHNVNIVANYLFRKKKDLELSVRWNLGSGLPFTPTSGFFELNNFQTGITTDYNSTNASDVTVSLGPFNSSRLPYYHRLDITLKKRFSFKNKTIMELIGSITNVYDRQNIFYVNRVTGQQIYQFPILPSLGLSYKF